MTETTEPQNTMWRTSDYPCKHGDFNQIPFWRQSFWDLNGDSSYPEDWLKKEGQTL